MKREAFSIFFIVSAFFTFYIFLSVGIYVLDGLHIAFLVLLQHCAI